MVALRQSLNRQKPYVELLRDRRWQRRRLEIFQRDDFKCVKCGCENPEVQVHCHHKYYRWGRAPWDYPDDALDTRCEKCHRITELLKDALKWCDVLAIPYEVGRAKCYCCCEGGLFFGTETIFPRNISEIFTVDPAACVIVPVPRFYDPYDFPAWVGKTLVETIFSTLKQARDDERNAALQNL